MSSDRKRMLAWMAHESFDVRRVGGHTSNLPGVDMTIWGRSASCRDWVRMSKPPTTTATWQQNPDSQCEWPNVMQPIASAP